MKYILILVLITGCYSDGELWTETEEVCLSSHTESYVTTEYDVILKIPKVVTRVRTVCDESMLVCKLKIGTGWFSYKEIGERKGECP